MKAESSNRSQPARRSFLRTILPYCNLLLATVLTFSLAGVTTRVDSSESENAALEAELAQAHAELARIQQESQQQFEKLALEGRSTAQAYEEKIKAYSSLLDTLESRLETIEYTSRDSTSRTDETVSAFRGELEVLRERLRARSRVKKTPAEIFREFEKKHGQGVVLIYTEFDYRRKGRKKRALKTVTGWGSGFFISEDGYIATNKHVVQPWKFDADLAAMSALGEIEIIKDSLRIACWRTGCRAFDKNGDPILTRGFNTWKLKNLSIALQAKDSMREREMDFGGFGPTMMIHALDNNDIVLLKAEGKNFHALPLSPPHEVGVEKLDPVMALGFPRGQSGLESGCVESSPSIGTVRKVENTIHVTASIIPGNSGGPLIGPDGRVVGIVTRVYSETLGICLKLDHLHKLVARLKAARKAPAITALQDNR